MEKKCVLLIGVTMVMLATVPVARGAMSEATVSYGEVVYTGTAAWEATLVSNVTSGQIYDSSVGNCYDDDTGSDLAGISLSVEGSFVETDMSSLGSSATAKANPTGGIEASVETSVYHLTRVRVTEAGTFGITLPYYYSFHATTQNVSDWARAGAYMQISVTDMANGTALANVIFVEDQQFSSDGTPTVAQIGGDSWIWNTNTDLTLDQELEISWYGSVSGRAFTADVTPVPLPGAALLAVTGLGYAGMWLRRRA